MGMGAIWAGIGVWLGSLFNGEPFRKMYDPWSEQMRRVILNKLEAEALHFAKSCIEHNKKRDAQKVLGKALQIIPDSEEIKKLIEDIKLCGFESAKLTR